MDANNATTFQYFHYSGTFNTFIFVKLVRLSARIKTMNICNIETPNACQTIISFTAKIHINGSTFRIFLLQKLIRLCSYVQTASWFSCSRYWLLSCRSFRKMKK